MELEDLLVPVELAGEKKQAISESATQGVEPFNPKPLVACK